MAEPTALCVDFGSTYTKAALVDVADGRLLGTASHATTIGTDVLEGYAECRDVLRRDGLDVDAAETLACSSAGGGLRIAVVGNEALVTAEAGRRVALSSGGTVVHVLALADDVPEPIVALRAARPDVVLLVGGTDGGNAEVLLRGARLLADGGWTAPVVVAGNADVRAEVGAVLARTAYVLAGNVMPRIGTLAPDSARTAIREVFLRHVIGGKQLSAGSEFAAMVRGATPDVVLAGVELVAHGLGRDVVVVDVGGATTDVHSVLTPDPEDATLGREVVATTPVTRTVEGDLGMRWSARTTVEAGVESGLLHDDPRLHEAARLRTDDPAFVSVDRAEAAYDEEIATAATVLAVRRHAGRSRVVVDPAGRVVERTGKNLRSVDLLIGSGGVLRHGGAADRVLGAVVGRDPEGWQYPTAPQVVVDRHYVLAAIGLLAEDHPEGALALARQHLVSP